MGTRKTSLGRRKIAIAKISNKNSLHVTFSKRRTGLFKKASELSTLCGAEIALLVFSPSNKVFSFGNPDVNSVIDRFNNNNNMNMKAYSREDVHNMMLVDLLNQLQQENDRRKELERRRKARQVQFWWEAPMDELNLADLEKLRVSLQQLRENVKMESLNKLMPPPPPLLADHHHINININTKINNAAASNNLSSWNVDVLGSDHHQFELHKPEICLGDDNNGHLGLAHLFNFDPEINNVFF